MEPYVEEKAESLELTFLAFAQTRRLAVLFLVAQHAQFMLLLCASHYALFVPLSDIPDGDYCLGMLASAHFITCQQSLAKASTRVTDQPGCSVWLSHRGIIFEDLLHAQTERNITD